MAFDPDAYLSKPAGGGFDPDAYLAAGADSDRPEWLTKGAKAPPLPGTPTGGPNDLERMMMAARAPQPEGPGIIDRVVDAGRTMAGGAGALYQAASSPIETLTNPSQRRELLRGVDDMVTAGYGKKLAGRIGRALGDTPDVDLQATEANDAAEAPGFRTGGNLVGGFGGASGLLTRGGMNVAAKTLGRVPVTGGVSGAAMGLGRGVLGYEAGAVPLAGLQADAEGRSPMEAMRSAATDPVGLALSAGGGAVGGAARGHAASIRDPRKLSGRTIKTIEDAGGEVRAFGKDPVRGGIYETGELTELPQGRAGINELADKSQGRIVEHNRTKLAAARSEYGQQQAEILAPHRGLDYDFAPLHSRLDGVLAETTSSNGVVGDTALQNVVGHVKKMTSVPDELGRYETAGGTVDDLLKAQKLVKAKAQYGSISTEENRPYRILDGILSEEGSNIDPRLGELKARYGKTMESLKDANDILYGSRKADIVGSASQERSAASRLGRAGDETQAATGASQRQLEELRQLDPAYARELQLIEAKKAAERIRYGEPEVSTSIEKGMAGGARRALLPTAMGGLGYAIGGPLGAAVGAGTSQFAKNPLAMQLRLTLPAAEAVGRNVTGSSALRIANPIVTAREKQRQRDAENSRILGGGR